VKRIKQKGVSPAICSHWTASPTGTGKYRRIAVKPGKRKMFLRSRHTVGNLVILRRDVADATQASRWEREDQSTKKKAGPPLQWQFQLGFRITRENLNFASRLRDIAKGDQSREGLRKGKVNHGKGVGFRIPEGCRV